MEDITEQIHLLRTGHQQPENRNGYWSKAQDEKLVKLFENDVGITEIAVTLGRTEVSVMGRLLARGKFLPQTRPRLTNKEMGKTGRCRCIKCHCTDCENCGFDCKTAVKAGT